MGRGTTQYFYSDKQMDQAKEASKYSAGGYSYSLLSILPTMKAQYIWEFYHSTRLCFFVFASNKS